MSAVCRQFVPPVKRYHFNGFLLRIWGAFHTCCICRMSYIIHIYYIYISYTIHYNISFPKEMGNTNCRTSFEGIGNCFKAGNGGLKYLKQPCDSTRWNGTVGQVISCNTALVKGRGIPSPIIKLTNCNVTLAFNMSIIENKQLDTIGLVRS